MALVFLLVQCFKAGCAVEMSFHVQCVENVYSRKEVRVKKKYIYILFYFFKKRINIHFRKSFTKALVISICVWLNLQI